MRDNTQRQKFRGKPTKEQIRYMADEWSKEQILKDTVRRMDFTDRCLEDVGFKELLALMNLRVYQWQNESIRNFASYIKANSEELDFVEKPVSLDKGRDFEEVLKG